MAQASNSKLIKKLEGLDSAQYVKNDTKITDEHRSYKSGAKYDGQCLENHKSGNGVFIWPNGDYYEGSYESNYRHGFGIQKWLDGCSYEGHFFKDKKSGKGKYKTSSEEEYDGSWFHDCRHGIGKYKWENGCRYEGMFFMNFREGYGKLIYPSGNVFIGLYKHDNRFGPGVLSYVNNTEDIGFWRGENLIRLIHILKINFEMPDTDPIDRLINLNSWYDREILLYEILNPPAMFCNKYNNEQQNRFIREDAHIEQILAEKKEMVAEYLQICLDASLDRKSTNLSKLIEVPNITRNLIEIFKHTEKYNLFKMLLIEKFDFNPEIFKESILRNRKEPGYLETASLNFLQAAIEGNVKKMKELKSLVNVNVCDSQGLNSLLIAVIQCNVEIINFLLDNGANINHVLDNGLTSLMICVIRYYSSDKFLPNTALKHKDLPINRKLTSDSIIFDTSQTKEQTRSMDKFEDSDTIVGQSTKSSEFESFNSVLRYKLNINNDLINKYANLLSNNDNIASTFDENIRLKAVNLNLLNKIGKVIELLLQRGANPSLSQIPYPALTFAVAAGDTKIVRLLLEKGASCNDKMPMKYGSLSPLSLACGVLGETGPELVELLLKHNADPNDSADVGSEYLSMSEEDWANEAIPEELIDLMVGRTPLHIVCARSDPLAAKIVKLLIENSANPNLICNGQSPLSLAIASGNRDAIDILLKSDLCDPSLPLTHGIGSALCCISSTLYEHHWTPSERIKLIDKLVHYGANITQPIAFGPRRYVGTVVDYAHYMHTSDTRIAHTPYHSLTHTERETFNSRKELLNHLGKRHREKMVENERITIYMEKSNETNHMQPKWGPAIRRSRIQYSHSSMSDNNNDSTRNESYVKKNAKWCYNCGRSVSVKLVPCSRCKKVFYCSNACKQKSWNEVHKKECSRAKPNDHLPQNNELALNFLNQEHNSFLSENIKSKATTRQDANSDLHMNSKQISFFLDEKEEHRPASMKSVKSTKSTFSKQFELKLSILEKKLGKKRFVNDNLSKNPIYGESENYSFN